MWGSQSWLQPAFSRLAPPAAALDFRRKRHSRQGPFFRTIFNSYHPPLQR